MTEKKLQDLLKLKNYEEPDNGYFDDFLLEFQQRQRSELLKTSARCLLFERVKAWFSELGVKRWIARGAVAFAAVMLSISIILQPEVDHSSQMVIKDEIYIDRQDENRKIVHKGERKKITDYRSSTVSMQVNAPVDFSSPAPVFSSEERIF